MQSGTIGDKLAAYTLQIQDSPVHRLPVLDKLVAMAAKKGKREALLAIGKYCCSRSVFEEALKGGFDRAALPQPCELLTSLLLFF